MLGCWFGLRLCVVESAMWAGEKEDRPETANTHQSTSTAVE